MSEEKKSSKRPDMIAYAAQEGSDKSFFHQVGVAWANKKEGYNIRLFAIPVDGEIILLPPKAKGG